MDKLIDYMNGEKIDFEVDVDVVNEIFVKTFGSSDPLSLIFFGGKFYNILYLFEINSCKLIKYSSQRMPQSSVFEKSWTIVAQTSP